MHVAQRMLDETLHMESKYARNMKQRRGTGAEEGGGAGGGTEGGEGVAQRMLDETLHMESKYARHMKQRRGRGRVSKAPRTISVFYFTKVNGL